MVPPKEQDPTQDGSGKKVVWVEFPNVTFQLPSSYDTNIGYLSAMFGFNHSDQLHVLLAEDALQTTLKAYGDARQKSFYHPKNIAIGVNVQQLLNGIENTTILNLLSATLPISAPQLGQSEVNAQVVIANHLVAAAQLIKNAPTYFQSPHPKLGPYAADDWVKAIALLRTWYRSNFGARALKTGTARRPVSIQTLRPASWHASAGQGSDPVTAVTGLVPAEDFPLLDILLEDIEDEDSEDEGNNYTDYDADDLIIPQIANIESLSHQRSGRPLLTTGARDALVARLFQTARVLSEEAQQSDDLADTEMARAEMIRIREEDRAEMGKSLARANSLSEIQKQNEFWQFQAELNTIKNLIEPTYAEACPVFGLDPHADNPAIEIHQVGAPALRFTPKPWQIIGAAWIHAMEGTLGHALLADDCGIGKTLTLLTHVYEALRRAKSGRLKGPFKPTMVIVPTVVVASWFSEIQKHFGTGMVVKVWHGSKSDANASLLGLKEATLGSKAEDLVQFVETLDPMNPMTAVTVVLTSYVTGFARGLRDKDGNPVPKQSFKPKKPKKSKRLLGNEDETDDLAENQDQEEAGLNDEADEEMEYSSPLTGLFHRVVLDEAHKAKNPKTLTHKFITVLQARHYIFLTATPMANTTADLLGYLYLIWDANMAAKYGEQESPVRLYGLKRVSIPGDDDESDESDTPSTAVTAVTDSAPHFGQLYPVTFRKLLRDGNLDPHIAKVVLPLILRQFSLCRGFADVIIFPDGRKQRIGQEIPTYDICTVELAFKRNTYKLEYKTAFERHIQHLAAGGQVDPALALTDSKATRNMGAHRRLCQPTASLGLERLCVRVSGTRVDHVNRFHVHGTDNGMSFFQKNTSREGDLPVYADRASLAYYICRMSPKLAWLVNYVNEAHHLNDRVLIFCDWPMVQWLVEGLLTLLNFEVRSIRSAHAVSQRVATIAEFNDSNKRVDALVCSFRTSAFGLNIQTNCHRVVHVEVPGAMSTLHQANGRVHRLGQTQRQDIRILTLDGSYDMYLQYKLTEKYLPQLMGSVEIPNIPQRRALETPQEMAQWDQAYGGFLVARMLGQRCSRMKCGGTDKPYSFEENPPAEEELLSYIGQLYPLTDTTDQLGEPSDGRHREDFSFSQTVLRNTTTATPKPRRYKFVEKKKDTETTEDDDDSGDDESTRSSKKRKKTKPMKKFLSAETVESDDDHDSGFDEEVQGITPVQIAKEQGKFIDLADTDLLLQDDGGQAFVKHLAERQSRRGSKTSMAPVPSTSSTRDSSESAPDDTQAEEIPQQRKDGVLSKKSLDAPPAKRAKPNPESESESEAEAESESEYEPPTPRAPPARALDQPETHQPKTPARGGKRTSGQSAGKKTSELGGSARGGRGGLGGRGGRGGRGSKAKITS